LEFATFLPRDRRWELLALTPEQLVVLKTIIFRLRLGKEEIYETKPALPKNFALGPVGAWEVFEDFEFL
jgi:hypothetical protein